MTTINKVLMTNRDSNLLGYLSNVPYNNIHEHRLNMNLPSNMKTINKLSPANILNGNKYVFDLKDSGFLYNMMIKVTLTVSGNNSTLPSLLGARIFSDIEFRQNSKMIFKLDPSYIIARTLSMPQEEMENNIALLDGDAVLNNNSVNYYIPIYCSFFENESNSILLNYMKRLQLICTLNDLSFTGLVSTDVKLLCYNRYYEDNFYDKYIENVYDLPKNVFGYDNFLINTTLESGSNSKRIELKGNFNCFCLSNIIMKADYSNVLIRNLKLECNGNVLVEVNNRENLLMNKGTNSLESSGTSLSYYFGNRKRDCYTGGVNLNEGPWFMTIDYDTLNTSATLKTLIEYFTISTIDMQGNIERNILY